MGPQELANELSRTYRNARKGDAVTMIHLFGITYANQLRKSEESIQRIVERSDIPDSYHREVHKGMKLARFVVPRG